MGKRLNARHAWRYNSLDDRDVTGSMRRAAILAFLVLWSGSSVIGTSAPAMAGPVGAGATGGGPVGNETGLPIPRYVTLRASEVNVRAGPGVRYPIEWVYQRQNLPVEVVAEFDTWRK
ncbi:MAG TPA: SH3 domain-containing protein, partial [Thalassobaculum sp.]